MTQPTATAEISPVIRCTDLAVGYSDTPVLTGLSFEVEAGSTVALVGRSGCGKTTLVRTLAGILEPIAGTATVLGCAPPTAPPPGTVGYIPQSLGLVDHETVLQNVLHGTLSELGLLQSVLGRFPPDAKHRAVQAIEDVELDGMETARVRELSGGQRRRVAIARALIQRPRVLLADEMLSELDSETARSIIDCIDAIQADGDMAVVIVEHDRAIAEEIADARIHLEGGTIAEIIGSIGAVGTRSQHG